MTPLYPDRRPLAMTPQPHLSTSRPPTLPASALSPRVAHLVGICGSGMKALAELLTGLGCQVTGSDQQPLSPVFGALKQRGLRIHSGHEQGHVPRDADVLVYSAAVGPNNPERRMASRLNIPQLSYSQMLGELMRNRVGVSIAGTHGKSTTTAMVAVVLEQAGLEPSAIIGAELRDLRVNGWAGRGNLMVVESCEYRRHFLDCSPQLGTILSIEPDHFDYFRSFEETQSAFADYAAGIAAGGMLIVRGDCAAAVEAARHAACRVETFSTVDEEADWWASDVRLVPQGTRFRIFRHGKFFNEVLLRLPGRHNVLNALAAAAVSFHAGASPRAIREALDDFGGIRRRFEQLGSWRGITLIDDFAHHPTAVRETLATARQLFPKRRIWCAFQPHQVSRTEALLDGFAASFDDADQVVVVPIYVARESAGSESHDVARLLASRIAQHGSTARFCDSLDRLLATLEDEARPGDVFLTLGAGDIDRVPHELTGRLQRNHSAG